MIIFDVEIKKAIQGRNEARIEGIEYCEGWRDFKGMGVACVCTIDTQSNLSRAFTSSRLGELQVYLATDVTGGFNTRRFDMPLLAEHGVHVDGERHYDALEEVWKACGLDPDNFQPRTHGGWGLDAIMQQTFGLAKTGHGAMAPVWWQQGDHSKVIDYCLNDVWLEGKLITHMLNGGTVQAAGKDDLRFAPRMFAP